MERYIALAGGFVLVKVAAGMERAPLTYDWFSKLHEEATKNMNNGAKPVRSGVINGEPA
jgi:hypothetical protein